MNELVFWLGLGCLILPMFAYVVGVSDGRESWEFLNKRLKESLEKARLRIGELADGLGGKCDKCKGFGVTGPDGQLDCWDCGGTGLRSLRAYRFEADLKLAQGQREAELYLEKVKEARRLLSNHREKGVY